MQAVKRHSGKPQDADATTVPTQDMALAETLKLLYSLLSACKDHKAHFAPSIGPLLSILHTRTSDKQAPISQVVNALFQFDVAALPNETVFPADDPCRSTRALLEIIAQAVHAPPSESLDITLSTPLGLIGELAKVAPPEVRESIKTAMLPSDDERNKPLGQGDTVAAILLRLSTSGHTPQLRMIIPAVLYELSDREAPKFVKNVGFGYAAGFLQNNNIPLDTRGFDVSDGVPGNDAHVNPVTGQFVADESPSMGPPMTEAEKEREAERLFVLFERFVAT